MIGRDVVLGRRARRPSRWNVDDNRAQIGKPIDRGRWGMTPPTSNAYYNPLLNEIVFPAGILQPPAFDVTATDAVNYGAIGVVIGHEISHGFDDQGAQFDAQGRLTTGGRRTTRRNSRARGQCVVRPVRRLLHRARHPPQRQARARRDRSAISPAPRSPICAYQKSREGKAPEPTHRRLHAGAAVLHRLGPVARRRDPSRNAAHDGAGRSAPDREVPRQRPAVEPAGVPGRRSSARPTRRWCGRAQIVARFGEVADFGVPQSRPLPIFPSPACGRGVGESTHAR